MLQLLCYVTPIDLLKINNHTQHHFLGWVPHLHHHQCIPERGGVVNSQISSFWGGQHDGTTGPGPKLLVPVGEIMGNMCVSVGVDTGSWLLTSVLGGCLLSSAAAGGLGWKSPPLPLPSWLCGFVSGFFFFCMCVCCPHSRAKGHDKATITQGVYFFQF